MIHVRYEGRSYDVPAGDLHLNQRSGDREVLQTIARFLDLDYDKLRHYVVDRRPSGTVIVRPEAVYG